MNDLESPVRITPLALADFALIWPLIREVAASGETYPLPRNLTEADARALWAEPGRRIYAAQQGAELVGTYYLRPNGLGPNAHVANAGYMVPRSAQGRGVAKALFRHSWDEVRRLGFKMLQFNLVVSTNRPAVHLWTKLGMQVVGTLPKAFDHPTHGLVDAYVMVKDVTP